MKILLVKTSSLGDLIHLFPVVEYLKQRNPASQIDWVVERPFSDLIKSHPLISTVFTINTKQWRKNLLDRKTWNEISSFRKDLQKENYDAVFDLQGNTKSGLVTALSRSKNKVGFCRKCVPELPNMLFTNTRYDLPEGLNIRADYLSIVKQFYKDNAPFSYRGITLSIDGNECEKIDTILANPQEASSYRVLVCAGSVWQNKQVSENALQGFLASLHAKNNSFLFFAWGTPEEKKIAENLHEQFRTHSIVLEKLRLPVLQNLMTKMDLVVAMDSLPLHLAGCAGVPTLSAFGASSAAKYKPEGPQHISVQGACPYNKTFERRCPILRTCATGACIKNITAEDLFRAYISQQ